MPTKDKTKQRRWCKEHYEANKQYYLERNQKRREEFRDYVDKAKGTFCIDCKRHYEPCQLDFDHVRGEKKANLSRTKSFSSIAAIEAEIAKCEVVCANCHRLRTYSRVV